jgi:hypothetical protein
VPSQGCAGDAAMTARTIVGSARLGVVSHCHGVWSQYPVSFQVFSDKQHP